MNVKVSRIRRVNKIPKFPHPKGEGLSYIFQLIFGILLWIILIIFFAITAWALWFNSSLAYLFSKPNNTFPWWFGLLCTIFVFPLTLFVNLLAFVVKIINHK